MSWFKESNRYKHFLLAIPVGFLFTILCVIGIASGMEFKDCHHDPENANKPVLKWSYKNWDWLDWTATMLGGLIGQLVQIGLLLLIL
jgi:hypothetical protein